MYVVYDFGYDVEWGRFEEYSDAEVWLSEHRCLIEDDPIVDLWILDESEG